MTGKPSSTAVNAEGATEGKARWGLRQGDEISSGRTVVRPLGGGKRCEVYLAWEDRMCSLVVVKLLRPDRIGSELALACDYRLMADGEHVIGQPEILLGFPPGGGGTQRLVRLIGTHQGLKRMLDGGGLAPAEAVEIGYVDEVIPADELIDRAVALGDHLSQRLKFTVAAVKRAAYIGGSLSLEDGLRLENAEFLSTLASPGAQAAMLAYMRRTDETGDLPLYDRPTYERTLEAGGFGGA